MTPLDKPQGEALAQLLTEVRLIINEPALLYPRECDTLDRLARICEVQRSLINRMARKQLSMDAEETLERVDAIAAGTDSEGT